MQLKYLNFYKIISTFSTNIIGAFVPLIIFDATGSIFFAFLFLTGEIVLRLLLDVLFKKLYTKYPQIFLLLRVFPIIIYTLCIFLISYNLVLGVILVGVFLAFANSFKTLPMENIFNYSSSANTSTSLGVSRLLEQLGLIVSLVMGGLFLEHLNQIIVIVIAIVTYLISVVPLVIYFVKERKSPIFNQEAISNAIETYKNVEQKNAEQKKVSKKIIFGYSIVYYFFCALDALTYSFLIYLFTKNPGSYAYAGYLQGVMWGMFGISSLLIAKLDDKKDITILTMCCALVISGLVCGLPFVVDSLVILLVFFAIIGLCYAPISYFALSRLLQKTRVMGVSNKALFYRIIGINLGQATPGIVGLFGSAFPIFFVIAGMAAVYAVIMPINEEKSRKQLVDYLQNNSFKNE